MMVGDGDLFQYYKTNFDLVNTKMFSITELDEMFPFERHVYITLLNEYVKEKSKEKNKR